MVEVVPMSMKEADWYAVIQRVIGNPGSGLNAVRLSSFGGSKVRVSL